jgi:outer membrane protein OmpA-like peptidoglycan-associated protein
MLLAVPARAQEPGDPDAEGCRDSALLTRMAGCTIVECSTREFDSASVQIRAVNQAGEVPSEALEGAVEMVKYACPAKLSLLQVQRNALNAFNAAGFTAVFSGKDDSDQPVLTARKGPQWVNVQTGNWNEHTAYTLTAVKVEAMQQEMAADATALADAITKTGSVAVYGITFETGKATLAPGSEQVLGEIVKVLKDHTDWRFEVQGHTDNVGAKAANMALSDQRARSVVAWLTGKGIDASRLLAKGYGDADPVADNGTDDGRAKNRRVELKKMSEE